METWLGLIYPTFIQHSQTFILVLCKTPLDLSYVQTKFNPDSAMTQNLPCGKPTVWKRPASWAQSVASVMSKMCFWKNATAKHPQWSQSHAYLLHNRFSTDYGISVVVLLYCCYYNDEWKSESIGSLHLLGFRVKRRWLRWSGHLQLEDFWAHPTSGRWWTQNTVNRLYVHFICPENAFGSPRRSWKLHFKLSLTGRNWMDGWMVEQHIQY